MANFIDDTYFRSDIVVPDSVNEFGTITEYISKYEKEVLVSLLGYDLYTYVTKEENADVEPYKELINGGVYEVSYGGKTVKVEWPGFKNSDKVSFIAYYVYCEYLRKTTSSLQQVGNVSGSSELNKIATILPKIYSAWSNFEELYGYPGQNKLAPSAYNYLMSKNNVVEFENWFFTNLKGGINGFDL